MSTNVSSVLKKTRLKVCFVFYGLALLFVLFGVFKVLQGPIEYVEYVDAQGNYVKTRIQNPYAIKPSEVPADVDKWTITTNPIPQLVGAFTAFFGLFWYMLGEDRKKNELPLGVLLGSLVGYAVRLISGFLLLNYWIHSLMQEKLGPLSFLLGTEIVPKIIEAFSWFMSIFSGLGILLFWKAGEKFSELTVGILLLLLAAFVGGITCSLLTVVFVRKENGSVRSFGFTSATYMVVFDFAITFLSVLYLAEFVTEVLVSKGGFIGSFLSGFLFIAFLGVITANGIVGGLAGIILGGIGAIIASTLIEGKSPQSKNVARVKETPTMPPVKREKKRILLGIILLAALFLPLVILLIVWTLSLLHP